MANKKKGQSAKAPSFCSWWKHLRPEGKRGFWKGQRRADKKEIKEQTKPD